MQTTIAERPLTIVLLNSWGKLSRYGDARRIQKWLEKAERRVPPIVTASASHT
jgi:D-alanyl-D-alanine endopeptidase (penicillin-binding protein 7)